MRVVALGGAGGMARSALSVLASRTRFDHVIVADLDLAGAEQVASGLREKGQPASARSIDVLDHAGLVKLLSAADLVVNAVGPYFRFGVPVLRAAIEARTNYIDICDDPVPTMDLLALDAEARDAGVSAVIGAGASPGLMNVFARLAADRLDEAHDVVVGWTLDSPHRDWDMTRHAGSGGGGDAALVHFFEQFTGNVPVYDRGELVQQRTRVPVSIDVPGLGRGTGYSVGHPEPVTLPVALGARGRSLSVCMMSSGRAAVLDEVAARIERNELALNQVAEAVATADVGRASDFPDGGDLPIYFVAVSGVTSGQARTSFIGCVSKPEPMALGTGIPFAVAIEIVARELPRAGVVTVEEAVDPEPYLSAVAELWDVAREDLFFAGEVEGHPLRIEGSETLH